MTDRDTFVKNVVDESNPWLNRAHEKFIDGYETREEAEFSGKVDVIDAIQAQAYNTQWIQARTEDRARRWERNSSRLTDHVQTVNANLISNPENGHLTAWNIVLDKENRMTITHARMRQSKVAVREGLRKSRALVEVLSAFKGTSPAMTAIQQETQRRASEIWDILQGFTALSSTITAEDRLLNSFQGQAKSQLPPSDDPLYRYMDWRIQIDVMYVNNWLDKIRDYKVQLGLNLYQISMMLHLHNHVHSIERISNKSRRDDQKLWIRKMRELERLEKWKGPQHQINSTLEQIQGASDRIGESAKLTSNLDSEISTLLMPVFTALGPRVASAPPPQSPPQAYQHSQSRGDPISPAGPPPQRGFSYSEKTQPYVKTHASGGEENAEAPPPDYFNPQSIPQQPEPQPQPKREIHINIHRRPTEPVVVSKSDPCEDIAGCCCGLVTGICACNGCPACCLLCTVM